MVATRAFGASQVSTVAPGMVLVNPVAIQARLIIALGLIEGRVLAPAGRYGAGWRSMSAQALFFHAYQGDKAAIAQLAKLGTRLSSSSRIHVAPPGTSSHGDSTRCDWVFNTHDATAADVAFMERHEWVQEFGASDQNHFQWTGNINGQVSDRDKNRVVAHWLNAQHLGRSTSTERDGDWPARSSMSWLLQTRGQEDGLYPTARYKLDGEAGDRTRWLRDHYASVLLG